MKKIKFEETSKSITTSISFEYHHEGLMHGLLTPLLRSGDLHNDAEILDQIQSLLYETASQMLQKATHDIEIKILELVNQHLRETIDARS